MKLNTYVASEVKKTGKNKTAILKHLAQESSVSLLTLQGVERGATLEKFSKAKAVSDATGGAVSVLELLDPQAEEKNRRRK